MHIIHKLSEVFIFTALTNIFYLLLSFVQRTLRL